MPNLLVQHLGIALVPSRHLYRQALRPWLYAAQ
jgi:hypothetical protein